MEPYFEFQDRNLNCHYSCDRKPDRARFCMHTHDRYELYIFFAGRGIFRVEGREYDLSPGDILLMRPSEAHYIDIDPNQVYERAAFHFSGELFADDETAGQLLQPFNGRTAGTFNRYQKQEFPPEIYSFILPNLFAMTENRRTAIAANLAVLLAEIGKIFTGRRENTQQCTLEQQIVSYVNSRITQTVTLDQVCSQFYISKSQLCRIFKATTGATMQHYISAKRLLMARQLLASGVTPVKAAALCGYNDYSGFYRAFVARYGLPPRKFAASDKK